MYTVVHVLGQYSGSPGTVRYCVNILPYLYLYIVVIEGEATCRHYRLVPKTHGLNQIALVIE